MAGYRTTHKVPNRVMVATAYATSGGRAPMTGAVATIAVLPQTAEPTAMRTASVLSTRTRRATSNTTANETAIVMTMTTVAGRPIRAISPRLSRAPRRMIPSRRTRREAKESPAASDAIRDPANVAIAIPNRIATVTSAPTVAIAAGRDAVTRRAAIATPTAAASPGAIERVTSTIAAALVRG